MNSQAAGTGMDVEEAPRMSQTCTNHKIVAKEAELAKLEYETSLLRQEIEVGDSDEHEVDLAVKLAPLTKDQLEELIAMLVSRHQDIELGEEVTLSFPSFLSHRCAYLSRPHVLLL